MATTDLIDVLAAAAGFSKFKENLGKVTNRGIEITLGGTPIRNQNLSWNTNLFFSQNKNKLVKLIEGTENLTYLTTNSGNLSLRAQVGEALEIFMEQYGIKTILDSTRLMPMEFLLHQRQIIIWGVPFQTGLEGGPTPLS